MRLADRLKKIEAKAPVEKQIIIVRYSSEITELMCGNETFLRLEIESEEEFIIRIRKILEARSDRPQITFLLANF